MLRRTPPGRGGEIQLTDALRELAADVPVEAGGTVHGVVFRGRRYDTGDKLSYLQAVVRLAADREDLGPDFRAWLEAFVASGCRRLIGATCEASRSISSTCLATVQPLAPFRQQLLDARGCVLAEDVTAQWPLPRFDNSAMDGYAVRADDVAAASTRVAGPAAGRRRPGRRARPGRRRSSPARSPAS